MNLFKYFFLFILPIIITGLSLLNNPLGLNGLINSVDKIEPLPLETSNVNQITSVESTAILAALQAVQIPSTLLNSLNLNGEMWPRRVKVKNNSCFDYIVVGVGTAGSIVANRLTEDENISVLAIEAGDDPPIESLFPLLFFILPDSKYDWDYYSTFDKYAASSQNGYTKLTAGKMLGGSSSLNHYIHTIGSPCDYDLWAEILEDSSWKYENVLKYFKKYENLTDPVIRNSRYVNFHGTDGPIKTERIISYDKVNDYLTSFGEAGNRVLYDLNGNKHLGYIQSLLTISGGVRQSTAIAYLNPAKDRTNLYVLRNTLVIKILFENKVAIGVIALQNDEIYVFKARKEVIVCAGVFNTPQVLMLSGIGPKEHLESFSIEVISDLPVGETSRDQVSISIVHKMDKSVDPVVFLPELVPTTLPFPVLTGLVTTEKGQSYADYQSIILGLQHDSQLIDLACAVLLGYKPEICDPINLAATGHNSLYTVFVLLNPKSRGNIRIQSTNPKDPPLITTGFLTDKRDLDQMIKYIKDYLKVTNSTYFYKIKSEIIDPQLPECKNLVFGTDEYWTCYVLHMSISPFHTTSSCAMGSVVDSKFRVKGVENLRVVDASAMLQLPSAAPNAAVLMMAEKASDDIKRDCGNINNENCT